MSAMSVRRPTVEPSGKVFRTSASKAGSARRSTPSELCTILPIPPWACAVPVGPETIGTAVALASASARATINARCRLRPARSRFISHPSRRYTQNPSRRVGRWFSLGEPAPIAAPLAPARTQMSALVITGRPHRHLNLARPAFCQTIAPAFRTGRQRGEAKP